MSTEEDVEMIRGLVNYLETWLPDRLSAERAALGRLVNEWEEAYSAVEFVSRNRGISGFIADYNPVRSVDDWEDFVRELLARIAELETALEEIAADAPSRWVTSEMLPKPLAPPFPRRQ